MKKMEKKCLVCYLGSGKDIVLWDDFNTRQEAVDFIKIQDTTHSSLQGNRFFIIEAYEVYK